MERPDVIHLHKQASVTLKERKVNCSVIKHWSVFSNARLFASNGTEAHVLQLV